MILKNRSASFRQELNLRDLGISQGEMWEGIRWAELIECERDTEIQHFRYICTEHGVMRDGRTILWECGSRSMLKGFNVFKRSPFLASVLVKTFCSQYFRLSGRYKWN